ncbi:hypothetical protein FDG2_1427 [Candidatus Protofrankia californiensis]|uniref:FtsK domain-containing protein n=1 Tax=Candidatus Protofrankia californiensis TaxID=1839754 RepID=A0A1C3NVK5_9ACTN|nr:hypothetical protein FDG2_1427 [Candidatus Protofrankia californiensis]
MASHPHTTPPSPRRRPAGPATVDTRVEQLLASAAGAADSHTALEHLVTAAELEAKAKADADAERAAADPLVGKLVARAKTALDAGDRDRAEQLLAAAQTAADRDRFDALSIRGHAVPLAVIGLLWAGAAAGHMLPGSGPTIAGLYLTLAVVWWWAKGRRAVWADRPRRRRHATLTTAAGAGWLYWAAATGATGWHAAVLWIGGYLLAAPYWSGIHIPNPPAPAPPAPAPEASTAAPRLEVTEQGSNVMELWARWVACRGGPVEGSRLTHRERLDHGREAYTVLLVRGKQDRDGLDTRLRLIASAMGMSRKDLEFEDHPDGAHRARLIVTLNRDQAAATLLYPGPQACFDPDTGMTYWGVWPDGQLMPWEAFHPDRGVFSGVILGASRSGKSRLIEQLCLTWMATGMVTVWMIDPQNGSSLPTLAQHADWPAIGTDKGRAGTLLRAVDIVGKSRTKLNGSVGRLVHPISRRAPALMVVIDECHMVFDPKIVGSVEAAHNIAIAERAARAYSKAGIGLVLASQNTDQSVFGNSEALRMNAWNLNGIIMRLPSNIAGNLVAGFNGDAKKLPPFGYAYRLGSGARDISGRSFDAEPVLEEHYATVPTLELEAAVRYQLRKQLGDTYDNRHNAAEDAAADMAAEFLDGEDLDPEFLAAVAEDDPAVAARLQELTARRPHWTPTPVQTAIPAPVTRMTPTGVTLRPATWISLTNPAPQPDTATETADETSDLLEAAAQSRRDVYQLITNTPAPFGDILDRSTYSKATVDRALNDLEFLGLIHQPHYGHYARTA